MTLNRRRFIEGIASAGCGWRGRLESRRRFSRLFAAAKDEKPLKLCMVSGSEEYKSNESLAAFQEFVEKKVSGQMLTQRSGIRKRICRGLTH